MSMMEELEQRSRESIHPGAEDYYQDGLLYCGKCHTAKQTRFTYKGITRTPMILCNCEKERMRQEEEEEKRKEREQKIKRLRKMGFSDSEMQNWTFAQDDGENEKLTQIAQRYVEHFEEIEGKGLLLYGSVGTGKTFIAACIANELIDRGHPCLVTNFARLERDKDDLDRLNMFDLLVIDDLGMERDSEYMGEIVQSIIDARYRSGKSLIITTNLTAAELKNPSDVRKQRIYSRLFEMCIPVEAKGKDRRKERLKADYRDYADLLGI